MEYLGKFDRRIIEMMQEAYLWLWDRSGVYVGTLIFMIQISHVLISKKPPSLISIGAMSIWAIQYYYVQGSSLRQFNEVTRTWTSFSFRKFMALSWAVFIVSDIAILDVREFLSDILLIVTMYIACVQVRDREPPEKLEFARQQT